MKKRSFKKLSAILAVAMIIAAIAPMSAQAATFTAGDFEYFVYKDASGSNLGEAGLFYCHASYGNVVIPATVTNASNTDVYAVTVIISQAFGGKSITSVTIPSTVEDIGTSAFQDCASLTNVIFEPGSKLATLGNSAFRGCESLESINLPDGLERIISSVFRNCTSLKTINIPASVNSIGGDIFHFCSSLNEITFNSLTAPNAMGSIFYRCAPTGKIYYPENGFGYDEAFFNTLFRGPVPQGWSKIAVGPPKQSGGSGIEHVNMSADVPKADVPGFGRDFSVSGEITGAPGVPESVMLNANALSPEFTSNKAANAAYSDALLHGQPVAFNALEVVDAANGQVFALPEGAEVKLKFELGKAYADKALTISQYDAAGKLIERFNVTCDGDGSAVINAGGLGLFVITREWI